jgi:hypothetical protein
VIELRALRYVLGMPRRRNAAPLALAVALGFCLVGCVQPTPHVIPTSEPSTKPVFASDAAALAAAKKAFTGYVAASDAIGNDGGNDPKRIAQWVTPARLKTETKAFDDFAKTGERLDGPSVVSHFELQEVDQTPSGKVALTAYVCDDVSGSRLLDSSGADITPSARTDVVPLQVHFQNLTDGSRVLVVEGSDPWSGSNFCS